MKCLLSFLALTGGLTFAQSNDGFESLVSDSQVRSEASVVINAPLEAVWDYNSHNEYAANWSVYFRSIDACPVAECPENAKLRPGDVGFVRRAYRDGTSTGIYWDEKTLAIQKKPDVVVKKMRVFNLHGFPLAQPAEYLVEQFYEIIGPQTTCLTFRSRLYNYDRLTVLVSRAQYAAWIFAGTILGKRRTTNYFVKNLTNIKAAIESGTQYIRVYPFEED